MGEGEVFRVARGVEYVVWDGTIPAFVVVSPCPHEQCQWAVCGHRSAFGGWVWYCPQHGSAGMTFNFAPYGTAPHPVMVRMWATLS